MGGNAKRSGTRCLDVLCLMLIGFLISAPASSAVNLRMQTDLGSLDLELFDTEAPLTVQNFMNYVNRAANDGYDGTFIHRSVPGFVVQGGGYVFNPDDGGFFDTGTSHIPTDPPVVNEADPVNRPNVRGTIAMAKTADPDSATSEWFFNLADNPGLDDPANSGGFTVFGRVQGDGMAAIDAIAAQPRCVDIAPFPGLCGAFAETPIIGNNGNEVIEPKHLAIVSIIGFDSEGDGAIDSLEDGAPNGGDGNNDGIPDSTQDYVASFPGSAGDYVVIETPASAPMRSLDVLGETFALAYPPASPGLYEARNGYAGFDISGIAPGAAVSVTMTLAAGEAPDTYYLYGPTPDDSTPHWYEFLFDGQTGAEISGNVITLNFVDGMRGDADMDGANGLVVASPGGPAVSLDADDDGVPDAIEDAGPNGGDANADGTVDRLQAHVASLPDINGDYVLLETSASQAFDSVAVTSTLPPGASVLGADFPSGFFSFGVTAPAGSGAVDVMLTLPAGAAPDNYYMYGPTPDNSNLHWYAFLPDGQTGAVISANVITLQFVDGARGDADLDGTNRQIRVTSGGPATDTDLNDIDGDGVSDLDEDNGPNGGDGNGDGTADSIQPHVVSLLQGSIGVYVVLETDPAYEFRSAVDASVLLAAYPSSDLEGLNFTHGLFGFTLTGVAVGGGASVRVILPDDNQPTTYYQRGATPDNQLAHWYAFLWDGQTGASFNGNVITLQFIDGQRGDDDLTADGVIIDPGGPASGAKNTGGGGGGGGGGCSLKYTAADPAQAGFWWLLLLLLSVQGVRLVAGNMKSTDPGTGRA
jgi:cyclophilin family peptidyl-prolyl cis-trans isomerase